MGSVVFNTNVVYYFGKENVPMPTYMADVSINVILHTYQVGLDGNVVHVMIMSHHKKK